MPASRSLPPGSIIDDLYAGTLDFPRWERGMLRLVDMLRATCTGIFAFDPGRNVVLRDEGYAVPPETVVEYRHWVAEGLEPRSALMYPKPVLESYVDQALLPMSQWRRTPLFNDFLRKVDCAYFLCTWLHKTPSCMAALSFQASVRRGPFDDSDRERLKPLLPHIARALAIRDQLEARSVRSSVLADTLSRSTFGVVILDAHGHVLEANAMAQDLLRTEPALSRDADGTLCLRGEADRLLRHWILLGRPVDESAEGLIHIPRPLRRPLSLLVAPVPHASVSWAGSHPRWMLFLFDPDAQLQPSIELLVRDLGISEREATIASLLSQGRDLQQIAAQLGITVHTARSHLKAVFSKTGLHTQAELVRRVLQGPAGALHHT